MLAAIASIPRERFVPADQQDRAYANVALPIGCGQTISQPLVVARMLETLSSTPTDRVLDVGTGSGYHAALLSLLAGHVWTIERHRELSALAERAIARPRDRQRHVRRRRRVGGAARARRRSTRSTWRRRPTRRCRALEQQLADGGRLVAPVGAKQQHLMLTRRTGNRLVRRQLEAVQFVPLVHGVSE